MYIYIHTYLLQYKCALISFQPFRLPSLTPAIDLNYRGRPFDGFRMEDKRARYIIIICVRSVPGKKHADGGRTGKSSK